MRIADENDEKKSHVKTTHIGTLIASYVTYICTVAIWHNARLSARPVQANGVARALENTRKKRKRRRSEAENKRTIRKSGQGLWGDDDDEKQCPIDRIVRVSPLER